VQGGDEGDEGDEGDGSSNSRNHGCGSVVFSPICELSIVIFGKIWRSAT